MKWINTKDRLPDNNQIVLGYSYCTCYCGNSSNEHRLNCDRGYIDLYNYDDMGENNPCWFSQTKDEVISRSGILFWMPIPEFPDYKPY